MTPSKAGERADKHLLMNVPVWMFQDEHGQSMLHFAAARSHGRNALFQLLQEADINVGYRDELYRTARDVAIQAKLPENIQDIDKWVLYMAARGKKNKGGRSTPIQSLLSILQDVTPCTLVDRYQCSRETCHPIFRANQ